MSNSPNRLRPAPPFIIGAGLLLWGWQNSFLVYAICMAIILEAVRFVSWRWATPDKEFNNISDLSGVGFFVTVVYIFINEGSNGIFVILSIMPFVLYLLVLTQFYSEKGKIKLSVLFISLRKMNPATSTDINREIDISLPYFMLTLISASAGNQRTIWFYIVVCALIGIVLFTIRPVRYHIVSWLSVFTLAILLSFAGQQAMRELQWAMERSLMSMFDSYMWRYRDPSRTTTAIGTLGRLKFSDRVVVRVKPDKPLTKPLYLREASYNAYSYGVWSAPGQKFTTIDPDISGTTWQLNQITSESPRKLEVATFMAKEIGVIPIPNGASSVQGAGIIQIDQNDFGAVNMEIREGWIKYGAEYHTGNSADGLPIKDDLHIANNYRDVFERLATELELYDKPDEEKIRIIKRFFADNFYYSLERNQRYPRGNYLENFLFSERKGHCEFFATTTTLLLREAGIPARYAVGYSVQEYSRLEQQYVARARHSHSWPIAFFGGKWQVVDTTPATWAPYEDEIASNLQGVFDLLSWIRYRYSLWQSKGELEDEETTLDLLWLLIPLIIILTWRLFLKERIGKSSSFISRKERVFYSGRDSEFYKLVALLEQNGYRRKPGETLQSWIVRIEPRISDKNILDALELHYRYRFDPKGLSAKTKIALESLVNEVALKIRTANTGD